MGTVPVDGAYLAAVAGARRAVQRIIYAGGEEFAPLFLRLAAADALTYDRATRTGGPNGSVRTPKELGHAANAGLATPLAFLQQIKAEGGPLTLADIIQIAGAVALEHLGGPAIALKFGRKDSKVSPPEGRLPAYEYCKDTPGHYAKAMARTGLVTAHWVALSAVLPYHKPVMEKSPRHGAEVLISPKFFDAWLKNEANPGRDTTLLEDGEVRAWVQKLGADEPLFYRALGDAWQAMSELGRDGLTPGLPPGGAAPGGVTAADVQTAAAVAAGSALVVAGSVGAAAWWLFRRRRA